MSVSTTSNRIVYTGNGANVNFSVTFQYYDQTHLQVYVNGVLKTLTTHYTVLPTTNTPHGTVGGTVTFLVAPGNGLQVLILRVVPNTQASVLEDLSRFPATTVEGMSDLLTFRNQEQDEKFGRAILLPVTSTLSNVELPDPALTANQGKYLRTTSTGLELIAGEIPSIADPVTTKGDLIVGDATGLVSRMAVGNDGDVVEADSAQAKGVKWANPYYAGQGRLTYVNATSIKFIPYNGDRIRVKATAWQSRAIPSAGISAANTNVYVGGVAAQNLAANTVYRVYVFDLAGTLTIDFRVTAHAVDATTGVEIATGVDTRTLIGMIRTNASSQFEDSAGLRGVLSWFNRRMIISESAMAADLTNGTTVWAEIDTALRPRFLVWSGDAALLRLSGSVSNNTDQFITLAGISLNSSATPLCVAGGTASVANAVMGVSQSVSTYQTEDAYYVSMLGSSSAGTGRWCGADVAGAVSGKIRLSATVWG